MKIFWTFIFFIGFSNSFANDNLSSFHSTKPEMIQLMTITFSSNEEKAKVTEFINRLYTYVENTVSQLTLLNKELQGIDVSFIWDDKNYYDKGVLDKTIAEHLRLVKNQQSYNRIFFGRYKEVVDMINNSMLSNSSKKQMIDGIKKEFSDEAYFLLEKRQSLYTKLIKINSSVIEFIRSKFGKLDNDNGTYNFKNEKDVLEYNNLLSQYKKIELELVENYKKGASLRR